MKDEKDQDTFSPTAPLVETEPREGETDMGTGEAVEQKQLPPDPEAERQRLIAEKQDLYDRLLRKQAELENIRKRAQREKEEFQQHASAELIRALLPTLDGFERALQHQEPTVPQELYRGLELIYREMLEVLRRAGLRPIEANGKNFDPHFHQAVETIESTAFRDHEVVEELQRGYLLKHRLLRPAIVKVAVRPSQDAVGTEQE